MNLYQKMVELRKSVTDLHKDTRGYGYNYVSGDQVLSKIRGKMDELNLLLVPQVSVGEHSEWEYTNSNGDKKKEIIVAGDMSYCWINADNPEEKLVVPWAYFGQMDDASKAFGASLTYSERYFLLKFLALPTDSDDPDAKGTNNFQAGKNQAPSQQQTTSKTQSSAQQSSKPTSKQAPQQEEKSQQQKDAEEIFNANNKKGGKPITGPQQKRLIAKCKGNMSLLNEILQEFEVDDIANITMGDEYEAICDEADARAEDLENAI